MENLEEDDDRPHHPPFFPMSRFEAKMRDRRFLRDLGEVLKLPWLKHMKSPEEVKALRRRLMPSFACRSVEINDSLSLQEILMHMNIDDSDYDDNTALHRACETGNTDAVQKLLALGATCILKNRFGYTPLYLAIKNKHYGAIKLLMQQGARVTQDSVRVAMDLIKAVRAKDYRLVHAWHLADADMNRCDYNGHTALHAAVEKKNDLMVSKLLQYGASPEIADIWGRTPADEARMNNLHNIMVLFNLTETTSPSQISLQSAV